jgi:hypothetical protein
LNSFLQDIRQPYWWIGVVVVGLALNVLASYVRDWIDRGRLHLFGTLQARAERRRKRIEDAAVILQGRGLTRMYHLIRSISVRLRGVVSLILAATLVILGLRLPDSWVQLVLVIFAGLSLLAAIRLDSNANEMEEAIQEAVRKEQEAEHEGPPEDPNT